MAKEGKADLNKRNPKHAAALSVLVTAATAAGADSKAKKAALVAAFFELAQAMVAENAPVAEFTEACGMVAKEAKFFAELVGEQKA
jgi:hypothetical protein